MRAAALAFVAGAWLLQQQGDLPRFGWIAAAALAAIALLWLARTLNSLPFKGRVGVGMGFAPAAILSALAFLVLGFAWAAWRAEVRLSDELPAALEGRDL